MMHFSYIEIWLLCLLFFPLHVSGQCISGDCVGGEGVYQLPSNAVYEGEFRQSEIHGTGFIKFSEGHRLFSKWAYRFPVGVGRLMKPDGTIQKGRWSGRNLYFSDGPNSGELLFQLDAGDIQSGCIDGNCRDGKGTYGYVDGSTYTGEFSEGIPHGMGTWRFPNGDVYKGHIQKNEFHGNGVFIKRDGTRIEGKWSNGVLAEIEGFENMEEGCQQGDCDDGYGVYMFSGSHALYRGAFRNGLPSGYGTAEYANGERYYGQWKEGSYEGPGTLVLLDGTEINGFWEGGIYKGPLSSESIDTNLVNQLESEGELIAEGQIYSLIIGVSSYEHMPPLNFADDDAYRLYAFLRSPDGSAIPEERILLLIDEDATYQGITGAIDSLSGMMSQDDLLLLYFSGHGLPEAWLPVDFNGMQNRIYYEELVNRLSALPNRHILMIMDACHSGSLYPGSETALSQTLQQVGASQDKEFAIISSAKAGESALEARGLRQGVFSHFLLRGLQGEADLNRDSRIQLGELYAYLEYNVRHFTRNKQSPRHFGQWKPDAVLPFSRKN